MAILELVGAHVLPEVKTALLVESKKQGRPVSSILNNILVAYLEAAGHELTGKGETFQPAARVAIIGVSEPWGDVVTVRCVGESKTFRAILGPGGTLNRVGAGTV